MTRTLRTVMEVLFSLFIGFLIVFTVSSLLNIIWSEQQVYDAFDNSPAVSYISLYKALAAITIATIMLFASLKISDNLRVLANGLLFGGAFTTFYGIFSISSYNSPSKVLNFAITLFALIVAVVVSWLKFVKMTEARKVIIPPEVAEVNERLMVVENTLERMKTSFNSQD